MASSDMEMRIGVDQWFTDSRLRSCLARDCLYHSRMAFSCELKYMVIDEQGRCDLFRSKDEKREEAHFEHG